PPACQVVAVFCEVTTNGPAVAMVRTITSSCSVQPATPRKSRTVIRKVKLRVTLGNTSHMGLILFTKSCSLGKYREGDAVGIKLRNIGPSLSFAAGGSVAEVSRS